MNFHVDVIQNQIDYMIMKYLLFEIEKDFAKKLQRKGWDKTQ